ncbi:hypothetical protein PsorP6_002930 [Peronosclerospora sorghi]|uniref:Uncharacterized protein n=1 Tax=Peronosclerospora sorghi TaxID=230839 RepID=A0ACC0VL15_9STRA|nr:hypothetical protein PsorP6_002930 [Peronosclerospora sorghi]
MMWRNLQRLPETVKLQKIGNALQQNVLRAQEERGGNRLKSMRIITDFDYTVACAVFYMMDIVLVHAWLLDDQYHFTASQSSANPPYLPSVPSRIPSTEATATAPSALQASVSRRTVDNYTNEPTHFYSTQQTSKHQCGDVFTESDQTAQAPQKTWDSPPAAPASASNATQSIPDFDELTARIERLRQRQDRHEPKNLSFTF